MRTSINTTLAALGLLAFAACTLHAERYPTPWLKVDIARPKTGTSGVIVVGSSKESFSVLVGEDWRPLGSGHPTRYMVLGDDEAALVDLNDNKGVQIIRSGEPALRPLRDAFGRDGPPSISRSASLRRSRPAVAISGSTATTCADH